MTNEEAIKIIREDALEEWFRINDIDECYYSSKKYVEAYSMAIDALKKQELYGWHDLRMDPDVLPDHEYESVLVWLENRIVDVAIWNKEYGFRPWYSAYFEECVPEWEKDVIAWKRIEPFKESEK